MTKSLILYTTVGCHLCEQAKELLWPELAAGEWQLREVDIAQTDEMIARYGVRIPVIAKEASAPGSVATGEELDWPFTAAQLQRFLRSSEGQGGSV